METFSAVGLPTEVGSTIPGLNLENGVTEDAAISLALLNNAAFQELLADLGISSARLFDAGLLPDPQFVVFFPLGTKQLEFTAYQAIDFLWLRPVRVRAAELDVQRVADQMVQNGLDLVRDVRLAHANLLLAQQQADLAAEAKMLREEIAELAQKRLEAGDVSELEVISSRVDALRAEAEVSRLDQEVVLAGERLKTLIGFAHQEQGLVATSSGMPGEFELRTDDLVAEALAMRPDARAAEIAVESACEQVELARRQFITVDGVLDANEEGSDGFEAGPGLRLTIPLFNRNRGAIAVAEANLEKAERQYSTLQDRIALEVRTAATQLRQAEANLQAVRTRIVPTLDEAQELARRNYEEGGTSYFLVLQTTGQYLDARMRASQLEADVRRAVAELERSVGRRMITRPAPLPAPTGADTTRPALVSATADR